MSHHYPFAEVEPRWQAYWEEHRTFRAGEPGEGPKFYCLDMYPYPSGAGLHVGHAEGYTATDIVSRYKRMRGFNVMHPTGWDAFGLPAEQYAIKTGVHPAITTAQNIANFRRQMKRIGLSYDWDREVDTTDPDYYRWTQWIFLRLFERGLAYVAEVPVNWCPELGTVLANEEVVDGKSEIGGFDVVRRPMRQWVLKITAYAERLLEDLRLVDWPASTLEMQRNWIGRSTGADVDFPLEGVHGGLRVFTTRPDTLFGATYMVLAPEHPLVPALTRPAQRAAVEAYREAAARKSDLQRAELQKEKTGVFTGSHAVNPVNGARLPIWIADYVMMGYGTGAIMAVPGHDQRDWEFARAFDLPVVEVVSGGDVAREAFVEIERGRMVNSSTPDGSFSLDGLTPDEAIRRMTEWLERTGKGRAADERKQTLLAKVLAYVDRHNLSTIPSVLAKIMEVGRDPNASAAELLLDFAGQLDRNSLVVRFDLYGVVDRRQFIVSKLDVERRADHLRDLADLGGCGGGAHQNSRCNSSELFGLAMPDLSQARTA